MRLTRTNIKPPRQGNRPRIRRRVVAAIANHREGLLGLAGSDQHIDHSFSHWFNCVGILYLGPPAWQKSRVKGGSSAAEKLRNHLYQNNINCNIVLNHR